MEKIERTIKTNKIPKSKTVNEKAKSFPIEYKRVGLLVMTIHKPCEHFSMLLYISCELKMSKQEWS